MAIPHAAGSPSLGLERSESCKKCPSSVSVTTKTLILVLYKEKYTVSTQKSKRKVKHRIGYVQKQAS